MKQNEQVTRLLNLSDRLRDEYADDFADHDATNKIVDFCDWLENQLDLAD